MSDVPQGLGREPAQPDPAAKPLIDGRFSGRQVFQDNLRQLFAKAAEEGPSQLILCDTNFEDWPLGESGVVQDLARWSKRGRRLVMLAHGFSALPRQHPRFVRWRQTWDHIIDCRVVAASQRQPLLRAFWSNSWILHHFDGERFDGYVGEDTARRFRLREDLQELIRGSSAGFPATTLGL